MMNLKESLLILFLVILASIGGYFIASTTYESNNVVKLSPIPELNEQILFELIQDWRINQKLPPYIYSEKLCNFAKLRLKEIEVEFSHQGYYDHRKEINAISLGENLAENQPSEQHTLDMWVASPSHLKNLTTPFVYTCIKTEGQKAVQIFANF